MPDSNCPYCEYVYENVMSSNLGFYGCKAKPEEWDPDLKRIDYSKCDSDNYKECSLFIRKSVELRARTNE